MLRNLKDQLDVFYSSIDNYQDKIHKKEDSQSAFELVKFVEDRGLIIDDFGYYMGETLITNERYLLKTLEYLMDRLKTNNKISISGLNVIVHVIGYFSRFKNEKIKKLLTEFLTYSNDVKCFDQTKRLGDNFDKFTNPP